MAKATKKEKEKEMKEQKAATAAQEAGLSKRDKFMQRVEMLKTDKKSPVMFLDGSTVYEAIPAISTGIYELDYASGIGGVPRGRIVEIYGPESSGKTTLALCIAEECIKTGGVVLFIDAEHALDINRVRAFDLEHDMAVAQPDTGEEALELVDHMVDACDLIIVDSVAALVPKAEIEGEMGDSHMGLQARLMSQALRKLTGKVAKSNCVVIFINQIRMKIGVMFGSPETTTGGNALKFYASMRLDTRKVQTVKAGEVAIYNVTKVKFAKNKTAPPFTECLYNLYYEPKLIKPASVVEFAVAHGIIEKAGTWHSFEGERIGQGKDNAINTVLEDPALRKRIEDKVKIEMDTYVKSRTKKPGVPSTGQETYEEDKVVEQQIEEETI